MFLGSSVDPRIHEVADGRPSCTPGSQLARPIVPLCPDVADQAIRKRQYTPPLPLTVRFLAMICILLALLLTVDYLVTGNAIQRWTIWSTVPWPFHGNIFAMPYQPHHLYLVISPLPDAMIGVPIGAAKSVPLCILLKPSIGCFLIPKAEESLAPLIGVFINAFSTLLPFSS